MKKTLFAFALIGFAGLLTGCGSSTAAQSSPSPSISASPSPAVSPSPTVPAGFVTTPVTGGGVASTTVTAVRVGQQDGFDRFVIEFGGGVPAYSVTPQNGTVFTRSPKGDQVTLAGTTGVLVNVSSVTNWTSYTGPNGFKPGYPFLREASLIENFEGSQQWALGVQGTVYMHVYTLTSPNRLVVDVIGI